MKKELKDVLYAENFRGIALEMRDCKAVARDLLDEHSKKNATNQDAKHQALASSAFLKKLA